MVPDGIIGHSVGELGCAYADGCLTAEQMILAAYFRGLASLETEFIKGSMASIGKCELIIFLEIFFSNSYIFFNQRIYFIVGVGYDTAKYMVPPDIDIACHNGPESCTVSGPAEIVQQFVNSLQEKGIFAREVKVSNIAYHSRYIAEAGPKLLSYMKTVQLNFF